MGLQGVPIDKEKLISQIYQCQGNLNRVAERLGVLRTSLSRQVREDPRIKAAVDEAREARTDKAEGVIYDFMDSETPSIALDAAKFELTKSKHGRARGWGSDDTAVYAGTGSSVTINRITPAKPEAPDASNG